MGDVVLSLYGDELTELQRLAARWRRSAKGAWGKDGEDPSAPEVMLLDVRPRPLAAAQAACRSADLDAVQALRTTACRWA